MSLSSTVLLFTFLNLIIATPTICPNGDGAPGGVYLCPRPNFQSFPEKQCEWRPPTNECYNFVGYLNLQPTAIGPDPGGYCLLYQGKDCKGSPLRLPYGGRGNG